MNANLRILVVEDSPDDFRLMERHFSRHGMEARCHCVATLDHLKEALEEDGWDLVLSDFSVPGLDFQETLGFLRARHPDLPMILISGSIGEEKAVELLKLGVWDFVLKDNLTRLVPAVERCLRDSADRRARRAAEEGLAASERRYRALFEGAAEGILVADVESRAFLYANPAICRMLGYTVEELLRLGVEDIHPKESLSGVLSSFEAQARGDMSLAAALPCLRKDGTVIQVDIDTAPVEMDGRPCVVGFFTDITGRVRLEAHNKELETQLLQAQKLEAVGRLAGGVAHDFNNMLSVILGYAEMAMDKVSPDEGLYQDLREILAAGERSRDITRQLLAFARRQIIDPRVLDLNATVEEMLKMLRRLLGEDIDLAWLPGAGLWPLKMDPSQIDQILANLCVNARDAIADVGKVTIETKNVTVDEAYCATHAEFAPGEYVMLAVSDDGCGMERETRDRIFEPFFTTKGPGKGTGLGLSTVYGVVKQNNGFINVYSEPGKGTTFKIYLPRHAGEVGETRAESRADVPQGRGETLLLAEDEPAIMKMGRTMLEKLGYKVLAAGTPREAVRLAGEHAGDIHLLVTDVVMPEMNGRELAERIQALHPDMKRLFMSGYTTNAIAHRGVLEEGVHFVQKPFSLGDLAAKVRRALDGS